MLLPRIFHIYQLFEAQRKEIYVEFIMHPERTIWHRAGIDLIYHVITSSPFFIFIVLHLALKSAQAISDLIIYFGTKCCPTISASHRNVERTSAVPGND
jgi:hypothetical protein